MPDKNLREQPGSEAQIYTIPKESAAPEAGATPKTYAERENWADKEDTAQRVWKALKAHYALFSQQGERTKAEERMKNADRMMRVSERKPEDKADMETVSNVADPGYFTRIRAVSSGEQSIYFDEEGELPAVYRPFPETPEYTPEQGTTMAESQNALERYTFLADGRREKVKDIVWFANKYGNLLVSDEWEKIEDVRKVNEPVRDADGNVVKDEDGNVRMRQQTRKFTIKDSPSLIVHDLRNCYFDATIDDMQKQLCIITRTQDVLSDIYARQAAGEYKNVGKIGRQQMYEGEGRSEILDDRKDNADEEATAQINGLFDRWEGWIRVPINDKGEWDEQNMLPEWFWATFIGRIESDDVVCVRLIPNPYHHKKNPFKILHTHRDDKGAFHMGAPDLSVDMYWQSTTNINQSFDNVNLRNRAPTILKGQAKTRDLTASPNKVIKLALNATLERQEIPDTTQITMQQHDRIEDMWNRTLNTDKPIMGEALGSRTSATEAKRVFDQAEKPALEKAAYFSEQLFVWLLEMDMALWRQFADPKRVVKVTGGPQPIEIKPRNLWGPLSVKVVAVPRFAENTIQRQQILGFMANGYAQARPDMTRAERRIFLKEFWKAAKLPQQTAMFQLGDEVDAQKAAKMESRQILLLGEWDEPQQGEVHDVHLGIHKSLLAEYGTLPQEEQVVANMQRMEQHILIHEQLQEQQQTQMLNNVQQGGEPPATPGQAEGDVIEAQEGALANV